MVLRLHDGSKVLRSPPWDLHGCKAADEIAFSLSLSLSLPLERFADAAAERASGR